MITDKIEQYLVKENNSKPLVANKVFTTMFTKKCTRQSAYRYWAYKPEEKQARTLINFELGYLVEKMVLDKAKLSGVPIELNNIWLTVKRGLIHVTCKPDGLYTNKKDLYNVEIKKMSEYGFKDFKKNNLDDSWGYISQANMECEAFKQSGKDVKGTIFIVVNSNTGHIAEEFIPYDKKSVDETFKRIRIVLESTKNTLPERAFEPEVRGNKEYLGTQCSYCDFHKLCYPKFKLQISKGGYPLWVN